MAIEIHSKAGGIKASIQPSESDRCSQGVMQAGTLSLTFDLPEYIAFRAGDYVEFLGDRYQLLADYTPDMRSQYDYSYSLKLYDYVATLDRAIVLKPADLQVELGFSYYATAREHIQLIVDNINRTLDVAGWSVGTISETKSLNIDYASKSCMAALTEIANKFQLEWWIEGRTINLSRCEHGNPVELGYASGLISMRPEESSQRPVTRLYPLGSTRNIDRSAYGSVRLKMPQGRSSVEQNTHLGIFEQAEEHAFSHIYPRYTGTVSSVRKQDRTGTDGKPYTVYYIKDGAIPFDPNTQELPGLVKHVVFQSGELNGHDFEANYHTKEKEWELITQYPTHDTQLPREPLVPKVGDTYIPWNFRMSEAYIRLAEKELEQAAVDHLRKISQDTTVYKAETDYVELMSRGEILKVGRRVLLKDAHLFARTSGQHASRIVRLSTKVNNPYEMDLDCSYAVDFGRLSRIEGSVVQLGAALKETQATLPTILKSWDSADPSEYNVLSALRTLSTLYRTALRKDQDDYTAHAIGSAERVEGLLGWLIRPNGDAYLRNLKIAGALEVDELRKNRITILDGEHYFSSGTAIIDEVGTNGGTYFRPRLEEGDTSSLQVGDACLGKWVTASGVQVCKLRVYYIDQQGNHWYNLEGGSAEPRVGMHLAQVGSDRDSRRQRATVVRNNVIIQYDGLEGWDIEAEHIRCILGDLDDMSLEPWGALYGSGAVLSNAYISGQLSVQSSDGRSSKRLPYDKGEWQHSIAYPYDQYEYDGHLWLWTGTGATSSYPSVDNGWQDLGQTSADVSESMRYLRRALSDSTDIQGGLILSTILALRDASGKVSTYLNGRATGADPMLALGVRDAFTSNERRSFWVDKLGRVHMGQMQARSSDGSLLCYTGDRDFAPYLVLGGGATNIRDLLNANPNQYGYVCYDRRMSWRGDELTVSGSGRHGHAQYLTNPIIAHSTSMRIKGPITLRAGSTAYWTSGMSLSVRVELIKGDWSKDIGSHLLDTGWLSSPQTQSAVLTIDSEVSSLEVGASYTLRVECYASSRGGQTIASVDVGEITADGDPVTSAESISIGEHGLSVMYGLDRILMLHPRSEDEDVFLDLYGKTNMPGVLAAGRVNRDGQVLAAWGAKVNKQGRNEAVVTRNSDNTYTVYHTIGHTDYIPQLTVENTRDTAAYTDVQAYSFRVRLISYSEPDSAYPNGFSYVLFGDNR